MLLPHNLESSKHHQPVNMIHDPGLEEQVSAWEEILHDQVLVGADGHSTAHTQ